MVPVPLCSTMLVGDFKTLPLEVQKRPGRALTDKKLNGVLLHAAAAAAAA